MHTAAVHLLPLLAAEKSKVPFYIAGGALVVWALVVSLGLGLRNEKFPGALPGERGVIAITVVLVIGAVSTAVLTSSAPATAGGQGAAQASPPSPAGPPPEGPPPPAGAGTSPRATTGSPAPPSSPSASASSSVKLVANPSGGLSYDTKQLSARAGRVSISLTNASPVEHNVTIAEGSRLLGATPTFTGSSKTLTLRLAPGTYTFFCSVPGHRQAGMEGTLKVS